MARIEAGEGDKGREREWLARAVRAPRDRAWIADGYVSDRWLPVSPVTGAVDAFEWKAPVDAIGRGDDTLLDRGPRMPRMPEAIEASATSEVEPERAARSVKSGRQASGRHRGGDPVRRRPSRGPSPRSSCPRARPTIRAWRRPRPTRAPTSLERLRAAQIR